MEKLQELVSRRRYTKDLLTSRAYQMERDTTMDPTVEDLLKFIDKQALALENVGPACGQSQSPRHTSQQQHKEQRPASTGKPVAYTAAQEASCLLCYAATGVDDLRVCSAA
ncbi:hypothetical protein JYU34_004025 [Plutella xylostella]|uniref:Uncharacterized protein n=1 Tax=Plutella xylostella TaxID=51655 RepID=A0ABQ7QWZ4_PLUXY|nr:hypothetical protein JYU34_004025 [Plutella xylostella]